MRELDVVDDGLVLGPFGVDGVGGGQDAGAGVQLANDAALGNRKRLLFHDLGNINSVGFEFGVFDSRDGDFILL